MTFSYRLLIPALLAALIMSCNSRQQFPNLVYILADDMGYGDVSALNPEAAFLTPNIDRLAESGMAFTDAHSPSSLCTPTRYGILTGRYAWRSPLKSGVLWSWDPPLIELSRPTVATMLREKGYKTACIGKWHLGLGWVTDSAGKADYSAPLTAGPADHGFDYSFIITASLDIPPYVYIENHRVTAMPDRVTSDTSDFGWWREGDTGADFRHENVLPELTGRAVEWISGRASENNTPFFLYLPLTAPHTPILPAEKYLNSSGTNPYGDFVVMVDDMVGRVVEAIEKAGLSKNTIIIFTSDNGCSPEANFSQLAEFGHFPSYIYRGYKADIFEGGHRIPFIVKWPEKIEGGLVNNSLVSLTDLFATMAAVTGYDVPQNAAEDSYTIPGLTGNIDEPVGRTSMIQHSGNGYFALRQGSKKLELCAGSGGWSYPDEKTAAELGLTPMQLYDLAVDPAEKENVIDDYPAIAEELYDILVKQVYSGRSTPGPDQENSKAEGWPGRFLTGFR
jgi:arylsulfatase A-like enzyme